MPLLCSRSLQNETFHRTRDNIFPRDLLKVKKFNHFFGSAFIFFKKVFGVGLKWQICPILEMI